MAIQNWASVSPQSGSGNGSTTWTAQVNTARHTQRSFDAYYTAGSITRTVHIIQAGSDLYINGSNPQASSDGAGSSTSLYNASNAGGNLTIQGNTNAKKITYETQTVTGHGVEASLAIQLPSSYTANGATTNNGANITGDPGLQGEFSFSFPITIPQNASMEVRGCIIHIEAQGDTSSETESWDITIVQAAADPYLWVGKTSQTEATVSLNAEGDAQTLAVYSNTSWTVS